MYYVEFYEPITTPERCTIKSYCGSGYDFGDQFQIFLIRVDTYRAKFALKKL